MKVLISDNQKEISNNFWVLKGIAILSVICAHVNMINTQNFFIEYCSTFLNNIGTIGVGIFYFISGYYYKFDKNKKIKFLINKIKSIIVPWVFSATIIWLYVVIRKGGESIWSWGNFVIGNGSIFYFMTNLIIYFVVFALLSYMRKSMYSFTLLFIIGLSEIFLIFESTGISLFVTPYLNFMLFIGYFSLGQYCQNYITKEKLVILNQKRLLFICIVFFLLPIRLSYWHNFMMIPLETVFIFLLYNLCQKMNYKWKSLLIMLGKDSFGIFLWHIPIAGIVTNLTNRIELLQYFIVLRPIFVCIVVWIVIINIRKILHNKNVFLLCMGINDKKIYEANK